MEKQNIIVLEPKYYLKYFEDFLSHIHKLYDPILLEIEKQYLSDFRSLSEDAKCLYVRMTTRKTFYFKKSTLFYPEISPDIDSVLAELQAEDWIEKSTVPADDNSDEFFDFFTKEDWHAALNALKFPYKKSQNKAQLIETQLDKERIAAALLTKEAIYNRKRDDILELFKFLYFGSLDGDFSAFILRDIGRTKFEERDPEHLIPRFSSRSLLNESLSVARAYRNFKILRDKISSLESLADFDNWRERNWTKTFPMNAGAQRFFERWTLKLAQDLERDGLPAQALALYRQSQLPPSFERQIRILKKLGEKEQALELCKRVLDNPSLDTGERNFAHDQLSKVDNRKAIRSTTEKLKSAEILNIDSYDEAPEDVAIKHYEAQGYKAIYVENFLWNSMLGVLLWDFIHSSESHYHFPLQVNPAQMQSPDFLKEDMRAIQRHLDEFQNRKFFVEHLKKIFDTKFATANYFVSWSESLLSELILLYDLMGWKRLRKVVEEMLSNPFERSRGFPDLLVYKDKEYFFVEVKSHRDKLSAYQLYYFDFFEKEKIPARILKFKYPKATEQCS